MRNLLNTKKEELTYLSSYISKLLKRNFGKGPESCFSLLSGERMFIHIKNFITPAEEVLVTKKEEILAIQLRSVIIDSIIEEFKEEVRIRLGVKLNNHYHDWNFNDNTGAIMLTGKTDVHTTLYDKDPEIKKVKSAVEEICLYIHKAPTKILIEKMGDKLVLIEFESVLNGIERIAQEKGYKDVLYEYSEVIKRRYFGYSKQLEEAFQTSIDDLFFMWDYSNEKYFLCFYLK